MPRDITDTTFEEQKIIFAACKALLPESITSAIEARINENKWTEISIFGDLFFLDPIRDTKKEKEVMCKFTCRLPPLRVLWDIVIGLYVLLKPEVYKNTAHASMMLFRNIIESCEKLKLDWREYTNFNAEVMVYLREVGQSNPDFVSLFHQPFDAIRFAYTKQRDLELADSKLTAETLKKLEDYYSKLSEGLIEREKQFQNRCLLASVPTSP